MRAAFTLIELMVVVAIVALLAGLTAAAVPLVLFNARATQTSQRMEMALEGLTRIGREEGSATLVIQGRAALEGVHLFSTPVGAIIPQKQTGDWIDASQKHLFAFPWSKRNLTGAAEPDVRAAPDERISSAVLADLEPRRSARLLAIAGILPADDPATAGTDESAQAFTGDRGRNRPWNDAWGNPLVVAYGLFQPLSGEQVLAALRQYQYNRSLYVAVGAAGPTPPPRTGDWDADLPAWWVEINRVCQPDAATTWTADGFDRPPWTGIVRGRRDGRRCLLTAPLELK